MYFITNGTLYWPFTILDWNYIIENVTKLQLLHYSPSGIIYVEAAIAQKTWMYSICKMCLACQSCIFQFRLYCWIPQVLVQSQLLGSLSALMDTWSSFCALTWPNESRSRLNKVRLRLWDAQCPRAVCDKHRERKQAATRIQMTGETIPTKLIYYLFSASTWSPVACYCVILIFYWLLPCVNCPIKFCNPFAKWTKNSNLNKLYAMLHYKNDLSINYLLSHLTHWYIFII